MCRFSKLCRIVCASVAAALGGVTFTAMPSLAQGVGDVAAALDRNMIVECLLPGAVRKLGSSMTYLTPRKVAKLAVQECEVRGGEYVLFDRGDPAQALKIWRPSAEQGDAVAQYRVGQIYEMGIGGTPDYAAAASWYKKAADQGNRAAALNLAVLYEKGLGVNQNVAAALTLYRKTQGLSEELGANDEVRKLRDSLKQAQERINQLESEIRRQRQSGASSSREEQELKEARATVDRILGGKQVPLGLVLDVGKGAGAKPSIQLIDPSLVLTRGAAEVPVRGEIKSRQIVARVKSRAGLASLTVNGTGVQADRFGFFETSVPVSPNGTKVVIVAVDRDGERDQVSLELKPEKAETDAGQRNPMKVPAGIFGNYYALVIGNNLYPKWGNLRTAVNDANGVADLLRRKYGFKTTVLTNATRERVLNALNDFVKSLGEHDNLLIYYAGHGYYEAGISGYWIPVDAETNRDTQWILNVYITNLLLKMNARSILVVSDSCYSGTLTAADNGAIPTIRGGVSDDIRLVATRHIAEVPSRTVLTSGALQPVWDVGIGGNSLFARAFLDVLSVNDSLLEGYRLFEEIEGRVIKASQAIREREERLGRKPAIASDQTPLYAGIQHAGHQGGDFVFVPSRQ